MLVSFRLSGLTTALGGTNFIKHLRKHVKGPANFRGERTGTDVPSNKQLDYFRLTDLVYDFIQVE